LNDHLGHIFKKSDRKEDPHHSDRGFCSRGRMIKKIQKKKLDMITLNHIASKSMEGVNKKSLFMLLCGWLS